MSRSRCICLLYASVNVNRNKRYILDFKVNNKLILLLFLSPFACLFAVSFFFCQLISASCILYRILAIQFLLSFGFIASKTMTMIKYDSVCVCMCICNKCALTRRSTIQLWWIMKCNFFCLSFCFVKQ